MLFAANPTPDEIRTGILILKIVGMGTVGIVFAIVQLFLQEFRGDIFNQLPSYTNAWDKFSFCASGPVFSVITISFG